MHPSRALRFLAFLLLPLLTGCAQSYTPRPISPDEAQGLRLLDTALHAPVPLSDIDIQSLLLNNTGPGQQADAMVVGILDDHGPRFFTSGSASASQPPTADTLFRIGSITKVFTILLLEDMLRRGQMHLDDPVQLYLPASARVPTRHGKQITLFDLATHTSGLPRDITGPDDTPEQLYAFLSRCSLTHDPGESYEYSNLGMGLLGHAIALKAGQDYESLVIERICNPLHMDSTRITLTPALQSRLATAHIFPGKPINVPLWNGPLAGCGALHSTAHDLLQFLSATLGVTNSPLTPLLQSASAIHRTPSGRQARLAWFEDGGNIFHGGLVVGYHSNFGFNPEHRRAAVILDNSSASHLTGSLLQHLLNNISPRPRTLAPLDSALLDSYSGQYRFAAGGTAFVRRQDDHLVFQIWHGILRYPMPFIANEVFPLSQTFFFSQMWDNRITFLPDPQGPPRLVLNNPRENIHEALATRISTDPLPLPLVTIDTSIYPRYVGQYRTAFFDLIPFGPTLSIDLQHDDLGDHLMARVYGIPGITRGELFPANPTTFFPDLDETAIIFQPSPSGKTNSVLIHLPNTELRAIRTSTHPNLPAPEK